MVRAANKEKYSSINRIAIAERASLGEVDPPSLYSGVMLIHITVHPIPCNPGHARIFSLILASYPCLLQNVCSEVVIVSHDITCHKQRRLF